MLCIEIMGTNPPTQAQAIQKRLNELIGVLKPIP